MKVIVFSRYSPNCDSEIEIISEDGIPSIWVNGKKIWEPEDALTHDQFIKAMRESE